MNKMLKKFLLPGVATFAGMLVGSQAMAAASAADAAKLGGELTPLGAEKAANADGSIPAWDGGLTSASQAGFPNFRAGQHHPDPYANDKPLYTVTAANMAQYASKLTEGHKKLLQTYRNTYKMLVYPTHRSAAAPQRIYDATKRIATTAQLAKDGNGVVNAGEGVPFPIPKTGVEVFWNHVLRYRGDVIVRQIGQAPVTASGSYTMVKFHDETMVAYSLPGAKSENLNNTIAYFIQETVAPARLAGEVLLVQETLDQSVENRRAWVYNPGQRRVRRAPNVAFDNPGTNSDNLRTSDQFDMYNGSPQRYEWTLVGKSRAGRPCHQLLRRADHLDGARDGLRPDQWPLSRAGPGQRGTAQPRLRAEAQHRRLPAGGPATARRPLTNN
ncbi:MAG: outer rane lipoproteinsorting protein [Steroidobacteraceae bacterium]|nr:outer rane lipoproteinsorting protein [Steroidobacteraceae bacterium]